MTRTRVGLDPQRSGAQDGGKRPRDRERVVVEPVRAALGPHGRLLRNRRALAGFTHARPDYGIDSVERNSELDPGRGAWRSRTPFCQLLRFCRQGGEDDPKILLVAPMSGHFATLLQLHAPARPSAFVTDWINPRNVKLEHGNFSLADDTQHLIDFVGFIGEDCHVVAACQPTVWALAATAVLAQDGSNAQPASLDALMAGPIDARIAPTKVNELAQEKPIEWFRRRMIGIVPDKFEGAGRWN